MAFPASDMIRSARDQHPAFTEQITPDPVLLRELTEFSRELRGRLVKFDVSQLLTDEVVALPLGDFAAGHTLASEAVLVHGGEVTWPGGETADFDLIDWRDRHGVVPRWCGWLRGQVLHLIRNAAYWTAVSSITLSYVPVQPAITAPASSILLPDRARPAIIAHLADLMARRVPKDSPVPVDRRDFKETAAMTEGRFLEDLSIAQRVKVTGTREVW